MADADFTIQASVSAPPTRRATSARARDTESYTVDVTAPAPTITLTSNITADDVINAAEAGGTSRSPARWAATANGDTVTLTVNGVDLHRHGRCGRHLLDQRRRARTWWPTPTSPSRRSVTTTDAAGNVGTATDTETYTVDVTAPAPTITLTSNITADDVINAAEAGGSIAITGTVGGDAQDGDTVTLTVNGTDYTGTVSGGAFSINVPGARPGGRCRLHHPGVASTPSTRRGNVRHRHRHGDLHGRRDASAPTITLTSSITADDVINAAEAGGTIAITGTVGGEAQRGRHRHADGERHELHRHGGGGQHLLDQRRRARDLVADADFTIQASVTSTDAAGNVGTASDTESYTVDVTAPAPTITLTSSITADDVINAAEAGGSVAITGTVGGDAMNGDTVTLIVNGTNYTGTVSGGAFSINVPGAQLVADADFTIQASVIDLGCGRQRRHGHATPRPTRSTSTSAPTITLTSSITADDVINAAEAGGTSRSPARWAARRTWATPSP